MNKKEKKERKRFFSIEFFIGVILMGILEQKDIYNTMTFLNTITFVIMGLGLIASIDYESSIWDYVFYKENNFVFTEEHRIQFWIILSTEIIALIFNFSIPLIRYAIITNMIVLFLIAFYKSKKELENEKGEF